MVDEPQRPEARPLVLVAEDNAINRKVAARMLEKLGYAAQMAENGEQAVEAFDAGAFDAILMDCQMPKMDGFEAARAIRQREGESRVPIIAMTAEAISGSRDACLAAGMDDYLSKPVRLEHLAAVLKRWIERT